MESALAIPVNRHEQAKNKERNFIVNFIERDKQKNAVGKKLPAVLVSQKIITSSGRQSAKA
ncbi:hypothetical protein VYA_39010 [Vibrio alfacsensis]|nr:hypothetical protein VA249_39830 [Vibrio alfacsensis]BCN26709.1 hypothetical protein VYA_39010 [Vibrio alfacsensis]